MQENTKPHQVAFIRESECIGCVKCIQVCPVDSILGSKNEMHTVIVDECIGCKLCIPVCPVDCIDMVTATSIKPAPDLVRYRHQIRKARLASEPALLSTTQPDKKNYVMDAIARAKARKFK